MREKYHHVTLSRWTRWLRNKWDFEHHVIVHPNELPHTTTYNIIVSCLSNLLSPMKRKTYNTRVVHKCWGEPTPQKRKSNGHVCATNLMNSLKKNLNKNTKFMIYGWRNSRPSDGMAENGTRPIKTINFGCSSRATQQRGGAGHPSGLFSLRMRAKWERATKCRL
jgi:hypothetical protein